MRVKNEVIFSIVSNVDLGVGEYYLDDEGYSHIVGGHRDLRNFVMGIEETVRNPTHIYKSSYDFKRLQFLSHKVLSRGGHPMNVIVEIEKKVGRVVTASPKSSISGQIVWDIETGLHISYDKRSDVLYLSVGTSSESYATEASDDERIWFRFHEEDNTPSGVTLFQARFLWSSDDSSLARRLSDFLQVKLEDVARRVNLLLV